MHLKLHCNIGIPWILAAPPEVSHQRLQHVSRPWIAKIPSQIEVLHTQLGYSRALLLTGLRTQNSTTRRNQNDTNSLTIITSRSIKEQLPWCASNISDFQIMLIINPMFNNEIRYNLASNCSQRLKIGFCSICLITSA